MQTRAWQCAVGLAAIASTLVVTERVADACGCLSPPAVSEGDYAVNQSAEQIIFEVEPNFVTAHVLIKYAGAPEKFAWIIPAPEAPELAISPVTAFGLIDRLTAPDLTIEEDSLCPISEWSCKYHPYESCGGGLGGVDDNSPGSWADAGSVSDAGGFGEPPVTVIDTQVVGDYQTVTFRASEASAATQWLRDNGFIVNRTTSIYMEPYVQANMVFVAIKLVPGAGIDAIKPLKMKYQAAFPMIPLVLTAVAAQPHLTINAYVYAHEAFRPMGHPIVELDADRLAQDRAGRSNYPQLLARTIDEAGGDGFAIEYRGPAVRPEFGVGSSGCCGTGEYDVCFLGNNSQCECPRDAFDAQDCAAQGDLLEGLALTDDLAARYTHLTRITTRVSAEEMQFDPTFEPHYGAPATGRLTLRGKQATLDKCKDRVIDQATFAAVDAQQACASTYCGPGGQCVVTPDGAAACACNADFVAQRFLDLDTKPSVTCVPRVPPVDLRADGNVLPDACAGVDCGLGQCADRNGIAVCDCNSGAAAVVGINTYPRCEPIATLTGSPGAQDYSEPLRDLDVCAPAPPACGADGWLVKTGSSRVGVDCGDAEPTLGLTLEPDRKSCGVFGCGGCSQDSRGAAPLAGFLVASVFVLGFRRRRPRGGA